MRYVEIAVEVGDSEGERLIAELSCEGLAVEERDASTLLRSPPGRVLLLTWTPEDEVESTMAVVEEALVRAGIAAEVRRGDPSEDDWRDAWKKFWKPRNVGPFAIVPSFWEGYEPRPGETVISLEPGRAFGTGGHASTRLMLEAIGRLPEGWARGPGRRVLDVGCGSGILAVACALRDPSLGCVAVDVDPDAAEVTRENAADNGVTAQIDASTTPLSEVQGKYGGFELVLANIQADVLAVLAEDLVDVAAGGHLVLGGILVEQAEDVLASFTPRGARLIDRVEEDGWCALSLAVPARGGAEAAAR